MPGSGSHTPAATLQRPPDGKQGEALSGPSQVCAILPQAAYCAAGQPKKLPRRVLATEGVGGYRPAEPNPHLRRPHQLRVVPGPSPRLCLSCFGRSGYGRPEPARLPGALWFSHPSCWSPRLWSSRPICRWPPRAPQPQCRPSPTLHSLDLGPLQRPVRVLQAPWLQPRTRGSLSCNPWPLLLSPWKLLRSQLPPGPPIWVPAWSP